MKKLLTVLAATSLVALAGVALTSCGGDEPGEYAPASELNVDFGNGGSSSQEVTLDKLSKTNLDKTGGIEDLFIYKKADPFISGSVVPGFEKALKQLGFTDIPQFDANEDAAIQKTQVSTALSKQQVLLVNAAQPNSAQGIIDTIKPTNKHVVFFNREMADSALSSYDKAYFVGTARKQPGELQGEYVAMQLIKNFGRWDKNHDGVLNYILLFGQAGNPEAIGRTDGFKEVANAKFKELYAKLTPEQKKANGMDKYDPAKNNGDVISQIGKDLNAEWTQDKAKSLVQSQLSDSTVTVEAIISNNDGMALGALQALNDKGYNKGIRTSKEHKGMINYSRTVLLTGVDGLADAKQALAQGKMSFTVFQDGGKLATVTSQVLANIYNGKDGFDGLTTKFPGLTIDQNVKKARVPYSPVSINDARKELGLAPLQ